MNSIALDISKLGAPIRNRGPIRNVFLVGCGASKADLYPGWFLLATEARSLRVETWTANEFVHATPAALDTGSIVILCSHSGGTRETVEAARLAQEAGALSFALTHNASGDIASVVDHSIFYQWGDDTRVDNNPMTIALGLCLEILEQVEGHAHYATFREVIGQIDGIVKQACSAVRERADAFARRRGEETLFYILSSGASFAHAYAFSICSLMEMQWLNAAAIHSGEFFHGPFEITDEDTNFIVLVNAGRTRPLDERVLDFLEQYADKVEIIDARALGLDALPDAVVDYFNPVLFYSVLTVYRDALARVREHPVDTRRYMGKVPY
ncbi:MAG: SIS domain-containing protein [Pseudomonadales bacterium]|jgi:fructoselysine-6-P-deglycase FrlB-like protein|nr:SIS domain-containing protein [Pseudomonadales bacterium]